MCHARPLGAAVGAVALLSMACAPRTGWVRLDHVCQATDPPRVCFVADPDAPLTLEVGGATLVPGECAEAPKVKRASLKVAVVDGRTGERHTARAGAGPGRTASVTATETQDGLDVGVSRERCGG